MMNAKDIVVSKSLIKKDPLLVAALIIISNSLGLDDWCSCSIEMEQPKKSLSLKRSHENRTTEEKLISEAAM